ncbi:lysophospholipase catalytic domain-containing protein [Melampsora americana]|nr:lysophospholipase catalytic domain-containing protein [Melampsora americana]
MIVSRRSFSLLLVCYMLLSVEPLCSYAFKLHRRDPALENSPSKNYAPLRTDCPDNLVSQPTEAQISIAEQTYVSEKTANSIPLWKDYLARLNLTGLDIEGFLAGANKQGGRTAETLPNFGFAFSGGGSRALCVGASILEAMDGRNERAVQGKVGGLVQLANYAAGLSGGSWLLGSWATANFPRLPLLNQTLWKLTEENDLWDWNIAKHYHQVAHIVKEKKDAGFPVSLVDVWGRIVSRHFIDDPSQDAAREGQRVLWSSTRGTEGYKTRGYPYIIAVSTSRPGPRQPITLSSPIYEYTPNDFSVWHPALNATMPIDHLGSSPDGREKKENSCVLGFENAGFVMGMSSNILSAGDTPGKKKLLKKVIDLFVDDTDYEGLVPNTFKGLGQLTSSEVGIFPDSNIDNILMADGGFADENIPLFPLIQPSRKLDAIIAVDSTANPGDPSEKSKVAYPNGTSIYMTYLKTQQPGYTGYHFPKIPNGIDGTFDKMGYNKRPTFFGCKSSATTPLVIYLPNYYSVAKTDIPSKETTYTGAQIDGYFENGFAIATQSLGTTQDSGWPECLACALIDRQLQRNGTPRPPQCEECFSRYCAIDS